MSDTSSTLLFMTSDLILEPLKSSLRSLLASFSSTLTLVIAEFEGMSRNEVYDAADLYLATMISSEPEQFNLRKTKRLRLSKTQKQKNFKVSMDNNEEVIDRFGGIQLKWKYVCMEAENQRHREKKFFELIFDKKFRAKVMKHYLRHVLDTAQEIKENSKVIKIYSHFCPRDELDGFDDVWGSMDFVHPTTFDTISMDRKVKEMIIDDLKRFLGRREFYKKVGKAWKRGYLLYGPPGTGKSSLVAAMANFLKFDVYNVDLESMRSNTALRKALLSTTNRSIIVIEDVDCSIQTKKREMIGESNRPFQRLTLSGILNFIDGLWSSCGDERIIVLTTNHKDRLDPALLRPGRMDLHIEMPYCTVDGFKFLAGNYLGRRNEDHPLFGEIERLLESKKVTPAEVAGELMRNEDAGPALEAVVDFIKRKRNEIEEGDFEMEETKILKTGNEEKVIEIGNNRRGAVRIGRGRGRKRGRAMSSRGSEKFPNFAPA